MTSIFFVLTIVALSTAPAFALNRKVAGKEAKSSGTSIRWTGGHGYNKVAWPSPYTPVINADHVNSMHMIRADLNSWYEVGWKWNYSWDKPKWFVWVRDHGSDYYSTKTTANPGTNHLLSVQVDTNEPGAPARLKVDGTNIYNNDLLPGIFADAVIVWGSERQSKTEDNNAHFWGLMKRRHDFSWALWENHQLYVDDDAAVPGVTTGYHLRFMYPSNYEGYSIPPDY